MRSTPTKPTPTRSTPIRSTSHELNSHEINFPPDQLEKIASKKSCCTTIEYFYSIAVKAKENSGGSYPNIFEIVDGMKKEQACTEMKMEQFESGATQPAR